MNYFKKNSLTSFYTVQCDTNPCELGGDFSPPNYQCLQAVDDVNNVICTCPDGQSVVNARCRKRYSRFDCIFFCSIWLIELQVFAIQLIVVHRVFVSKNHCSKIYFILVDVRMERIIIFFPDHVQVRKIRLKTFDEDSVSI